MNKRHWLTPLILVGVVVIVVALVSWLVFPGWRSLPGGVWQLIAAVIVGLVPIARDLIGIWKDSREKPPGPTPPRYPPETYPHFTPGFAVPFTHSPRFIGREAELERIHMLLHPVDWSRPPAVMLVGMPGAGKTRLAVEYAWNYRGSYPSGVYWVDGALDWLAELARLAEGAGLRADDVPEVKQAARLANDFAHFLDGHPESLLIFANVAEPEKLGRSMAGIVPANLSCRLLFTTPRDGAGLPFVCARVEVKPLPPGDALALLLDSDARRPLLSSPAGDPELEAARGICQELGYLPMALSLAGKYLAVPSIRLVDYRRRLEREGRLNTLGKVESVLQVQWEALRDREARLVWMAAALVAGDNLLPLDLLALFSGLPGTTSDGRLSPLQAAVNRLKELSLVEELDPRIIRLHPLVSEFAGRKARRRLLPLQRKLEVNALRGLKDPFYRYPYALAVAAFLDSLAEDPAWRAAGIRSAAMKALLDLVRDGSQPISDRRRAALWLPRLDWLGELPALPPAELLELLELAGRFVVTQVERRNLTESIISPYLKSPPMPLTPRQQVVLLIFRGAMRVQLGQLPGAEEDYREADRILAELLSSPDCLPEDYKSLARIRLGAGHLASAHAGELEEGSPESRELLDEARKKFSESLSAARHYGLDLILEASILKELSLSYAPLGQWGQALEYYRSALDLLDRAKEPAWADPVAWVVCRAQVLETASIVHWEMGQSLASGSPQAIGNYQAAYNLANQEINVWEEEVRQSQTACGLAEQEIQLLQEESVLTADSLGVAYFNSADYLQTLSSLKEDEAPELLGKACQHWQVALNLARRLEIEDLTEMAEERLAEFCNPE